MVVTVRLHRNATAPVRQNQPACLVWLYDSCPACRGLVRLEQVPLEAESLATCHACGFDLSTAERKPTNSQRAPDRVAATLLQVFTLTYYTQC
jgi:hypothetical protein